MKEIKFAVAVALYNPRNPEEVLAVKRPDTDNDLPGVWGLPAVVVKAGELPEDAVRRLGLEKLSTNIEPVSYIGIQHADRGDYDLILMDVRAELTGDEPSVVQAPTMNTKYTAQQWTSDYAVFNEAAAKGSLCSRILLTSRGIDWH
jgi:ADP-ribose pyrophosphatase YjhB (NUDIX family)